MIRAEQAAENLIVVGAHPGRNVPPPQKVKRGAILPRYPTAAGIAVAALETFPPQVITFFRQPQTMLRDGPSDTTSPPGHAYVNAARARVFLGAARDSVRAGAAGKTAPGPAPFVGAPSPGR